MMGGKTMPGDRQAIGRIVVFSRDGAVASQVRAWAVGQAGGAAVAHVTGGYEAAAELLAEPVAALVVDLPCLTARHARLLDVARRRRVEMIGVGPPQPASMPTR